MSYASHTPGRRDQHVATSRSTRRRDPYLLARVDLLRPLSRLVVMGMDGNDWVLIGLEGCWVVFMLAALLATWWRYR